MWKYKGARERANPVNDSPFAILKKNKYFKAAKWSIIVGGIMDITLLATGYYYYQQLKKSPDFRNKVYSYEPRLLDLYYRANEKYGDGLARKHDLNEWGIAKVESYSFADMIIKSKS